MSDSREDPTEFDVALTCDLEMTAFYADGLSDEAGRDVPLVDFEDPNGHLEGAKS